MIDLIRRSTSRLLPTAGDRVDVRGVGGERQVDALLLGPDLQQAQNLQCPFLAMCLDNVIKRLAPLGVLYFFKFGELVFTSG